MRIAADTFVAADAAAVVRRTTAQTHGPHERQGRRSDAVKYGTGTGTGNRTAREVIRQVHQASKPQEGKPMSHPCLLVQLNYSL